MAVPVPSKSRLIQREVSSLTQSIRMDVPSTSVLRHIMIWLLGLLLACGNVYWMIYAAVLWNSGCATLVPIFYNAIATLVGLRILSMILGRISPAWRLQAHELIIIYVMVAMATSVQMLAIFAHATFVGQAFLESSPESWIHDFSSVLPASLFWHSSSTTDVYIKGTDSKFKWVWVSSWLEPLYVWSAAFILLLIVLLCLAVLVRRQWREHDRLDYPLTQPVTMLVDPLRSDALWRTGLFWLGVSIGLLPTLLNGFAAVFPTIPSIHVKRQVLFSLHGVGGYQNAGVVFVSLNPFLFALGYLLPLDILLSAWVFYLLNVLFNLVLGRLGFIGVGNFPYVQEQATGAWIAIIISVLWLSRAAYLRVLKQAWLGGIRDPLAPLSYRAALVGLVIGFVGLLLIASLAGMSMWLGVLFLSIYFVLVLSMARAQAQFGALGLGLFHAAPAGIIVRALGGSVIGLQGLAGMTAFHWLGREYAGQPMPVILDGFRITERQGVSPRTVGLSAVVGGAVATLFSFAVLIALGYRHGYSALVSTYISHEAFRMLANYSGQSSPQFGPTAAGMIGFLISLGMMVCQVRISGWPLHPVGYALLGSYLMAWNGLWLPLLVAWLIKLLVLRYGGLKGFRRFLPLALGIVIGEFLMGSILDLIGMALGKQIYAFWPY